MWKWREGQVENWNRESPQIEVPVEVKANGKIVMNSNVQGTESQVRY